MSKHQHGDEEDAIGSDSFLDIASNIVGILIILVLVASTRIPSYVKEAVAETRKAEPADEKAGSESHLAAQRNQAFAKAGEVGKLTREAARLGREVRAASYAREKIAANIALAEQQLAAQRAGLGQREQKSHRVAQELVAARRKLSELQQEQLSLVSAPAEEVQITSYPSPISRTVFTKEEHYRLLGGKIVRIPFDELKDKVIEDRRQLIWKLQDLPEISGSVGPIDGFRLDYHFARTTTGNIHQGPAYYTPVQANLGEPLAEALAGNSAFRQSLARLEPANTTITVWIYPDSFDEFRLLKKELYQRGFGVAGRPLQSDARIGFSPSGSKSAAQ